MDTNEVKQPDTGEQLSVKLRFDHTRLVVGAEFFEHDMGNLLKCRVTEPFNLERGEDGAVCCRWKAEALELNSKPTESRVIDYLVCDKYQHYGPKIYFPDEIVEENGRYFLTR